MDCSLPHSSVHGIFQARVLEWVCHFLLQGIFLIQGSNLGLLQMLYSLSHGSSGALGRMSVQIFCLFLIGLFVYLLLSLRIPYAFWIQVFYQIYDSKITSPSMWFVFSFLNRVLPKLIETDSLFFQSFFLSVFYYGQPSCSLSSAMLNLPLTASR